MYYIAVPKDFLKLHKFVTLVEDVVFVNDVPFLITVSQCIKFVMVKHISTCTANQLSKYLKQVMKLYSRSGTIVQTILVDIEFYSTIDELMRNFIVNNSVSKEHVTKIERSICTFNERTRFFVTTMPFKYPHKLLISSIVYF